MGRLPKSTWWFAATAILFVLQWIPYTGIFLMFLLAPFWSVLMVNAGFVSLGIEAMLGRISLLWLLAPIAWFGGYAVAAQLSADALARLDAEVRAGNTGRTLVFAPQHAVIAVVDNPNELGQMAGSLVSRYNLPVVYTDYEADRRERKAGELPHSEPRLRAHRVGASELCSRIRDEPRFRAANIQGSLPYSRKPVEGPRLCAYSMSETPTLPVVRVSAEAEPIRTGLLSGKLVRVTIAAPDGQHVELRAGMAAALSRWPQPVMGCLLNSGGPSWRCEAGFLRQKPTALGSSHIYSEGATEVVARALDLEPRSPSDPVDVDTGALERALARHENTALDNLDRLLREPTLRATVHDFAGLTLQPELLAPRADAMLRAMGAALMHGKGESEAARNLQRLIAALPEAEFRRIGPEAMRTAEEGRVLLDNQDRRHRRERIDGSLVIRLGDLGAASLPLLERLAFTPRGEAASHAILGLCRLGEPGVSLAARLAEHVVATSAPRQDTRAAAYVTLMRWGKVDLAESLIDPEQRSQRKDYERRWPGLAPGSGPEVCTLR